MQQDQVNKDVSAGRLSEIKGNKTILVGSYPSTREKQTSLEHLTELESLCDTYGLEAVLKIASPLRKIDVATFLGKGKVQEILQAAKDYSADIILFDDEISPQQQRNLEKIFERIVIDRTELILGVFKKRASSREAKIQVELALFKYQLPRLKRLWTHLGRQRTGGGKGGAVKGEGEKQIEIDRRLLRSRISKLQKQLSEIVKTRETQRKARIRTRIPTFAIVGYTNAGKSTLFKSLTKENVFIEDKLFATLDTKARAIQLPNHQKVLLIDTVGFIRKIPHTLVASFKSTLEEALTGDILLHVVDVSSPFCLEQAIETNKVLKELGAAKKPIVTILNKIDAAKSKSLIQKFRIKYPKTVAISAKERSNFSDLYEKMIEEISLLRKVVTLKVPQAHYAALSELLKYGKTIALEYVENDIFLEIEIPTNLEHKIEKFKII